MLHMSEDQQHCAQALLKCLEKYRIARCGLVEQLEELDTQARAAQRELNSLQNCIAPITSLPEEVLAMVFEVGTHLRQKQGLHFALLVSHIARSWRDIALATPQLWTTIRCVNSDGTVTVEEPYPENVKERATAFLARSRSSPLDIYAHYFTAEDPPFLQLLGNHFGRCRHLCITYAHAKDLSVALIHFSRQSAPLLESFELAAAESPDSPFQLTQPLFPSGVPRLKTASLSTIDFSTFQLCRTAFRSVTSLRLSSIS